MSFAAFAALAVGCGTVGGCGAPVGAESTGVAAVTPAASAIHGVVRDGGGRPLQGAVVAIAHETDGTMVYGGGEMLAAVERRADQLPGVGRPAGAVVGRVVSGADGAFGFEDVAAGAFTFCAVHPREGVVILPAVSAATAGIDVTLREPTTLSAELKGIELDPLWTYVNLEAESPWPNLQLTLWMGRKSETGEYTTGPVPDCCEWTVTATGRNQARSYGATVFSKAVAITRGAENRVSTGADAQGQRLSGLVTGPDGGPLADVAVVARSREAGAPTRGAFTGADGKYVIEGLAAGQYDVEAVRHELRTVVGCGDGPVDVSVKSSAEVGSGPAVCDIRVGKMGKVLEVGEVAPDFVTQAIDAREVRLSDYRGRVVLLDFWATWCATCLADMKHIAKLNSELAGKGGLVVLSISLDKDHRAVERFLNRQSLPWPQVVLGPAGVNPIARLYNVTSTPTTMVIDQKGRIAARNVPGEALGAEIEKLLVGEKRAGR